MIKPDDERSESLSVDGPVYLQELVLLSDSVIVV